MKKVLITVCGIQVTADEPAENMELTTEGEYAYDHGTGYFTYEESEITGMEGTTTRFEFSPTETVIIREGSVSSRMIFVQGKKNVFLYDTPYGSMTMGIDTHKIDNKLTSNGGTIDIDYTLSFEHAVLSKNQFHVKIKEIEG